MQRFGSALNLNPHLHVLMIDGVYVDHPGTGQPTFVPVDPPTDEQLQHLIEQAAYRLIVVLERHGVLEDNQADPLADDSPLLAGLTVASIRGRTATGERAGRRLQQLDAERLACALKTPWDNGHTSYYASFPL